MLFKYHDAPDPDAWMDVPTWDETPVMPPSCKPLSFILNRPLARPQTAVSNSESANASIKPRSLPPVKYLPPPQKPPDPEDEFVQWIDDERYIQIEGVLAKISWERHPGPQSMYPRPKPIPGLSKKAKGRTVPTKEMGVRKGTTYTCKVEGCHKVFKRHDHLKRHVRSLHTHEQNYMCALPFCSKTFARRDNLLQHERKHKHYQAYFDCSPENWDGELMPQYRPRPADTPVIMPPPFTALSGASALPTFMLGYIPPMLHTDIVATGAGSSGAIAADDLTPDALANGHPPPHDFALDSPSEPSLQFIIERPDTWI